MSWFKVIQNGYITVIGTGNGGEEITEQEYNAIYAAIGDKPKAADGYDYRLKTDLTWELYELPPEPEEVSADEALEILLGGAE